MEEFDPYHPDWAIACLFAMQCNTRQYGLSVEKRITADHGQLDMLKSGQDSTIDTSGKVYDTRV